jgi:hypothetical protein
MGAADQAENLRTERSPWPGDLNQAAVAAVVHCGPSRTAVLAKSIISVRASRSLSV